MPGPHASSVDGASKCGGESAGANLASPLGWSYKEQSRHLNLPMIVTCPACSTRYLVDPRALGNAGRKVRCAHCTHTWHQAPAEDAPRPLEVAPELAASVPGAGQLAADDPTLDAFGRRRAARAGRYPPPSLPPAKQRWPARVGIALAALLVIGIVAGVAMRDQVVSRWPAAARIFATVGLPVPPPGAGLKLENVNPHRDIENGVPVLIVEGTVVNTTSRPREVPKILVLLRDKDNNVVQSWTFAPPDPHLEPGGSLPFRTSIAQPSTSATGIAVDFIDGS